MEEAGIEVSSVAILGSQPWPIGRGGSCELMIGCIAKAQSDDLHQDDTEMDEVRYSLGRTRRADRSTSHRSCLSSGTSAGLQLNFKPAKRKAIVITDITVHYFV